MCQWQILKMWCNVLKGTFNIHVVLYFNYLILFTIRGTSNIFLDIIETELASHIIVFCRLFLFPSQLSVKRTYDLVLLFHLNICIIVTTVLTAYETGICTFPPNSRILIIVSWIIDLRINFIKRTLLNEQYFEENKKGLHLFCLRKIATITSEPTAQESSVHCTGNFNSAK